MTRSKGVTPLSNLQVVNLLRAWGFEEAGYKGGHMVMALQGRRVQVAAPHRSKGETPYKALRKAARILQIPLKQLLAGPIRAEPTKQVPLDPAPKEQTVSNVDTEVTAEYRCDDCGQSFQSKRALSGHATSHKMVRCNVCGNTVVQSGLGSHQRACGPKKRGRGRPRKPIAESVGRTAKTHDVGIEVPILDDLDDDFPSAETFESLVAPLAVTTGTQVRPRDREALVFREVALNSDTVQDGEEFDDADFDVAVELLFPGRTLTYEQKETFLAWVNATRALFNSLPDTF